MGELVKPKVYLIGCTEIDHGELSRYLKDTGNESFEDAIRDAHIQGLSYGEILCSFYAKLCYASLSLGHNKNVSRTRDIPDNLKACFEAGHGSVFEHVQLNFVIRDCSRVFTHELVRHRVGTAFSQTSGRYVRGDSVNLVFDPILEPVKAEVENTLHLIEDCYRRMVEKMGLNEMKDFDRKKKITSALRRLLPNGQSNEMGFSVNLRAVRQLVQLRTSRHAEWEIRLVFEQIFKILNSKFPLLFYGHQATEIDGILEISGMKLQPWEKTE